MSDPVYATRADLAQKVPAGALAGISADAQDAALAAASRVADDSFRAGGWTLPLTAWSDSLTNNVCYITAYDLLYSKGAAATANALFYRQRYDDAIRWLAKIEKGFEPAGIEDSSEEGGEDAAAHGSAIIVTSPRRGW